MATLSATCYFAFDATSCRLSVCHRFAIAFIFATLSIDFDAIATRHVFQAMPMPILIPRPAHTVAAAAIAMILFSLPLKDCFSFSCCHFRQPLIFRYA